MTIPKREWLVDRLIREKDSVIIVGDAKAGKSVLKQLKPTFGAAFTVNEMLELKRMEAGLGKSVAGNRRILKNLQKVLKKSKQNLLPS